MSEVSEVEDGVGRVKRRHPEKANEPRYPTGPRGPGASDCWRREFPNGIEAYVTLWHTANDDFPFYLDIVFRADGNQNIEVGKIADEIVKALERKGGKYTGGWESRGGYPLAGSGVAAALRELADEIEQKGGE